MVPHTPTCIQPREYSLPPPPPPPLPCVLHTLYERAENNVQRSITVFLSNVGTFKKRGKIPVIHPSVDEFVYANMFKERLTLAFRYTQPFQSSYAFVELELCMCTK